MSRDGWAAPASSHDRRRSDDGFGRGLAHSLLVIPVAVPVWLILWQFGWIAGVVAFGVAFGAAALYRYGAKGRIGTRGAVAISLVTFGTILLCVIAAALLDASTTFAPNEKPFAALADPEFWPWLTSTYLADTGVQAAVAWNAALSLFLAALGALPTLIALLRGRSAGSRLAMLFAPIGVAVTAVAVLGILASNGYAAGTGGLTAAAAPRPATFEPAIPVGTCLTDVDYDVAEVQEMSPPTETPCDQPHDAEVVYVGAVDETVSGSGYPTPDWLVSHTMDQCTGAVSDFLGTPWDQSGYGLQTVHPSEGSWRAGDRAVSCWLMTPTGPTTGTLRGAGVLEAGA
ncbi:septum formation family protein [Herbiconiux sp.]|uniref:septum formation family protein n=1 Tax=Herbiconiux sp. TaxID=1871186 RepID=UPI0025C33926|nr:septum formation family protein [Herbiconiux sp.]